MEPIPETFEALEEFGRFLYDQDLLTELGRKAARIQEIVPECVGLSLAHREPGATFTLVASDEVTGALDGVQYLADGPCVTAVDEARTVEFTDQSVLDEETWQLFGSSTAAAGVASTLTLPIVVDDVVVGSVNLYASSPDAFKGKHREIAEVLGAWPEGAIANADLGFATRRAAQEAPALLFKKTRIQVAVGILVSSQGIPVRLARERLRQAAFRAGVSESAIARLIVEQATGPRPRGTDSPPG